MTNRLSHIDIDLSGALPLSAELEQEQKVAIFDLLEENSFGLPGAPEGPYRLTLGRSEGRLSFDLTTEAGAAAAEFKLSLGQVRQVVKDYDQICTSYYEAVKTAAAGEIETLDEARRAIHAEGARMLQERLEGKAEVDGETARRLFTLVCSLMAEPK
ncbi:MAG: UPF0262 family protein [Mangrovicoccus sp.]